MEIKENALDVHKGTVKAFGSGAHVLVPKDWIDGEVVVLLVKEKEVNCDGRNC